VTPERLQGFFASAKILQRLHSKRCAPFLFLAIASIFSLKQYNDLQR